MDDRLVFCIVVLKNDGSNGVTFPLPDTRSKLIFGRSETCDVRINRPTVRSESCALCCRVLFSCLCFFFFFFSFLFILMFVVAKFFFFFFFFFELFLLNRRRQSGFSSEVEAR